MRALRNRAGAQVAGIGVAIGLSSLAGYALLVLIGRSLSPADFALFVSFWGVLFGIGGALSIVEQETARQAAGRATGTEAPASPSAYSIAAAAAVIAGLVAALTMLPPVATRLYGDASPVMGLLVVVAALGFAVQFSVRGVLIGTGSVRDYAGLVVAEAVGRLLVLLAVVALATVSLLSAAVAVAVGSYAWLFWSVRAGRVGPPLRIRRRELGPAARRTVSLMVAAGLTAAMVTGYPAMVAALTDETASPAVGAVFAALTVSRVPLLLVSPVQAVTVPAVVRWQSLAETTGSSPMRRLLLGGTLAAGALGGLGALVGALWGPAVVRLVYGPEYDVAAGAVALLILSAFLLAWVLLLSAALVALAARAQVVLMWSAAVAGTAVWLLVSGLDVVTTTAVGALIGPLAAAAVAVPALWGRTAGHGRPAAGDGRTAS